MGPEGRGMTHLPASVQSQVAVLLDGLGGRTAIAARRLPARGAAAAEDDVQLRAHDVFPAASLVGLPITVEVLRRADLGQFDLSERPSAPDSLGGDGARSDEDRDAAPTIGELCARMLSANDAVAADALLDYVGMGEINETLSRLKLGRTKLARPATNAAGESTSRANETSADDLLILLALIHGRALPGSQWLLAMLSARPGLAANEATWLPAQARLAHCGGAQGDLVHDAGLLTGPGGACAYCILSAQQPNVVAAFAAIGDTLGLLWTTWRLG